MEKFTKGPWIAICPEQRLLVGESKEHDITQYEVMSVKTRGELTKDGATHYRKDIGCVDNISIAQAYWRDMTDEEANANAALIAAAPDMYEEIKRDIQWLKRVRDMFVIGSDMFRSCSLRIESKEKLLAKARGNHDN